MIIDYGTIDHDISQLDLRVSNYFWGHLRFLFFLRLSYFLFFWGRLFFFFFFFLSSFFHFFFKLFFFFFFWKFPLDLLWKEAWISRKAKENSDSNLQTFWNIGFQDIEALCAELSIWCLFPYNAQIAG